MPVVVMFLPRERLEATGLVLPQDWTVRFLTSNNEAEIIEACLDADFLLATGSIAHITANIIRNIPTVRLIQCNSVGYNHVDIEEATRCGIPVANAPGQNAAAVAEFTIGSIIALQRRIIESDRAVKTGHYHEFRLQVLNSGLKEFSVSRLGLIGYGDIAKRVGQIAGLLGASVSYFSRHPLPPAESPNITYKPLDQLLQESDIISLHLPLTSQTRGMIGKQELALMPPGSLFINTARGEIVDQEALAAALESGHLAGAAIDTFHPEPPGPGHPLLTLSPAGQKRVLLTPHTAGTSLGASRNTLQTALDNMKAVLNGLPPKYVVNGIQSKS